MRRVGGSTLYQRIIQPMEDQMIRSIWRIVHDPDDADDAMQDALATIWKRLDRIQTHPNPKALVLRICIDSAYDTLRRKHRLNRHFDGEAAGEDIIGTGPTAAERLEESEVERAIHDAIGQLPRNQSVALLMRIVHRCSYDEIADALACSESTVRVHLSRGRVALCQRLAYLNPERKKEQLT